VNEKLKTLFKGEPAAKRPGNAEDEGHP
jgi:hypothetical protein